MGLVGEARLPFPPRVEQSREDGGGGCAGRGLTPLGTAVTGQQLPSGELVGRGLSGLGGL